MYPTLYHFFYGVFGIQIEFLKIIPMLGFWIGIAFLAANWFGAKELKRRYKLGLVHSQKKNIVFGKAPNSLDLIINGIEYSYESEKNAEYLILRITKEIELMNSYDSKIRKAIKLLPNSTLVIAMNRNK